MGCEPLTSIQIETLEPAKIDFPGNFNKIIFINADTDINNDKKVDSVLYDMITSEMNLGFLQSIKTTASIDTLDYLYLQGFPKNHLLYNDSVISWAYLEYLSKKAGSADVFIILESIKISLSNESSVDYMAYPTVYIKHREMAVNIKWSVYDLNQKIRLDDYNFTDTLYWEKIAYTEENALKAMPSMEKNLREMSYFAAFDYGKRILPSWNRENRYYFQEGNKNFNKATQLIKHENDWNIAIDIWLEETNNKDRELASRACFNLALAYEIKGKFDLAIQWARESYRIKSKTKTQYYISILEARKRNFKRLQKQIQ